MLSDEAVTLLLPRSKTDIDNKGVHILMASATDEACPLTSVRTLLQNDPQPSNQPLLRLHKGAFERKQVLRALTSRLRRLEVDAEGYSGHSFRRGAAQEAHNRGLSEQDVQLLGRWKSDAVKRYFNTNPRRLHQLQKQFQGPT